MLDDVTRKMGGAFVSVADLDKIEAEVKRLRVERDELLEALEAAVECLANNGFGKAFVLDLIATVLAKSKGETDE